MFLQTVKSIGVITCCFGHLYVNSIPCVWTRALDFVGCSIANVFVFVAYIEISDKIVSCRGSVARRT